MNILLYILFCLFDTEGCNKIFNLETCSLIFNIIWSKIYDY